MKKVLFIMIGTILLININPANAINNTSTKQKSLNTIKKVRGLKVNQIDYNKVRITWGKSNQANGYEIYYSNQKNGSYKKLTKTTKNYYIHQKVKLNKKYYYKVKAFTNTKGKIKKSNFSAKKGLTITLLRPYLTVTVNGKIGLRINYKKVPYASYYQVYRSTKKNGKYKKIATTKQLYYYDKNLKKYYTYYYKIIAVKANGKHTKIYSKFSNIGWETTGESNAKTKLNLKSVYGDNEAYHPDILYFQNGWKGYKYWLVFTPFPKNNAAKENPHVKVSNDMKNWSTPTGTPNPLDIASGEGLGRYLYNSDPELVYNNILDRIECFWRLWDGEGETIYMKYTTDGHKWSQKQKVYYASRLTEDPNKLLSPTFVFENGKYKMWYANNYNDWEIIYEEYKSLPFEKPVVKTKIHPKTKTGRLYPWHLDVIKNNGKYEMLFIAVPKLQNLRNDTIMSLYYSSSIDGINWSNSIKVLGPSKDKYAWDNRGIYRSSMFHKDGKYYIFYSASNKKNIKGTSVIYGNALNNLKPLFN